MFLSTSKQRCRLSIAAAVTFTLFIACWLRRSVLERRQLEARQLEGVENVDFVYSDHIKVQLSRQVLPDGRRDDFMSRVVYNRVGKCGSRTMQNIIRVLAKRNDYNFYLSSVSNDTRPKVYSLMNEVKLIQSLASPMLYSRHIHYINFHKYGVVAPLYINLIRDPIARFSSNYHFKRYGDMIDAKGRQLTFKEGERDMDINECILNNNPECMPARLWYIIPYFCGQAAFCRLPGVEAVRRAKMNVMENYLAVGVLEDFEGSLKVFQRLLPIHFDGALDTYTEMMSGENRKNTSTVGKKKISPAAYALLRKRMELDYEFYDFVFSMFKNLKKKLSIV